MRFAQYSSMSKTNQLLAGAAQIDVTPVLGIQIAGDIGRYRPVEQIRDPLHARALVLQSDGKKIVIVSADICNIAPKESAFLRREIAAAVGAQPRTVMLHATQNHSGPSLGDYWVSDECCLPKDFWWLRGGDPRYNGFFHQRVLAAVCKADAARQPATLKAVRGIDGRLSFNRRYIMRDGTLVFQPERCHPDLLGPEGPTDPEVSLAVFENKAGRAIAALLHHTCHPTHGYPMRYISADWPGYWATCITDILGAQCIGLPFNGFCGNILGTDPLDPDHPVNLYVMAERLLETTRRIASGLKPLESVPLDCCARVLKIPMRKISATEIKKAKALMAKNPGPIWKDADKSTIEWDWMYALSLLDLAEQSKKEPFFDFEIQVFRIGELAIVGWPGEPFVEAQLELKLCSPAKQTFMAHEANYEAGYQPTTAALKRGGYETRTCNCSKLDGSSLATCTAATKAMMKKLFA